MENKPDVWRGSVERVSDRLRIHFQRFSELRTFLSASARVDLKDEDEIKR